MHQIPLIGVKAVGNTCNLHCSYCYEFDGLAPSGLCLMTDEVLERTIRAISAQSQLPICLWSGGEPLLAGREFFRKALQNQQQYSNGRQFINSIQSNGLLLDDSWIEFLLENDFQVGLSWDGALDHERLTPGGEITHPWAWHAIKSCNEWGLRVGIIMVAHARNHTSIPSDLIRLYETGVRNVLIKPMIARSSVITLPPDGYCELMCRILDVWLDMGDVGWQIEHMSSYLDTLRGSVANCEFANECYRFLTIEQNGDVTGCDFVGWRPVLGNVLQADLPIICQSRTYRQWKERVTAVPTECRECRWFLVCGGGCLHYRPYGATDGVWGHYQLCQVRQRIWKYYAERVAK